MYPYNYKTLFAGINHREIFVVMSFYPKYDNIFNVLIKSAVELANEELGFVEEHLKLFAFRTKEDIRTTSGWLNVLEHLMIAQINIGVLTGNNTNVFYELGIAHATQPIQRQILIANKNYKPTFDTKDLIFYKYDEKNLEVSSKELAKRIIEAIKTYDIESEHIIKKARMSIGPYDFEVTMKRFNVNHFQIYSGDEEFKKDFDKVEGEGSFERFVIGIKNLCSAGLLGLNTLSETNSSGAKVEFSYYWTSLGNDVLYMMKLITEDELLLRRKLLPDFFER